MMIMDPNGLERNSCMRSMYYPQGDVFVIVFSIRERYTFDRIKDFYGEITKVVNNPTIFLCANKCDLTVGNEVTHEEGIKMAQEIHAVEYIKTSALTGEGVDELFEKIIEKCYIAKENESKNSQPANNVNQENKNKNCEIA
ncbi:ras protein [Histomonas meleagridis]|uniref:ras protein n=1 Tax=Histomonas meleagridis TaxID=135588 RepID=UPI00355998BF|nr:ras protein [Histomonas meleagridis]KAH0799610.1 ras protein [Histomonas meleagridis]